MIRKRSLAALLLIITLLSASTALLLPKVEATVEAAVESSSELSDESSRMAVPDGTIIKYVTESPTELDEPPASAFSRVVDEQEPAWVTYYGTKLGYETLPPRKPAFESMAAGPEVPLGFWHTTTPFQGLGFNAMVSAPDGRLFASQNSEGLRVYAPDANGLYSWSTIDAATSGLASDSITDLAIFNDELWVATSDAGISRLHLADGTWDTYNMSNSGLPTNLIRRLTPVTTPDNDIYIWISSDAGAVRFTPGGSPPWEVFTMSDGLPWDDVTDIAVQFRMGTTYTWVSTIAGLVRWDGSTWANLNGGDGCVFGRATRIVIDNNGHAWFGAEVDIPTHQPGAAPLAWEPIGVCRHIFQLIGGSWQLFSESVPGLPSNALTDLSVDQADRIWMSFGGGAAVYDQGSWDIFTSPERPLASNNVRQVEAVGEMIWFSYGDTPALTRHTPNWTEYLSPLHTGGNGTPGPLLVEETSIWVGIGNGIALRDDSFWFAHDVPGNSAEVSALARDHEGTLWIGTAGNGLFTFDEVNTFTPHTMADGLPSNDIRALVTDYDGNLWVATAGGLALRGNGYWLPFTQATSPLPSDDLQALTVDSTNQLWIGTAANGIAILDPDGSGNAAWSTQTSADGLPSDTINGLTTDPSGTIWAATDAGLASHDPTTQSLTVYQSNDGSIPSDEVLTVAADPAGRLWVGTASGLAHFEANSWQQFHVPGSTQGSDRIADVASDGKRLWVTAGPVIAARGVITSPIGNLPPLIDSFTPTQGPPLSQVTINGSNFDDRGPQYNEVYFDLNNIPTFQGQVISATSSSLTAEVPLLARSGKIYVKANGLNGVSAENFIVTPQITSIDSGCLAPGELLRIHGRGFTAQDASGVYVKVGNGEWRLADAWDASLVRHYIRPGDTSGPVYVRLGQTGPQTTSPFEISIITPEVTGTAIQQGIQGEQMIWGKRTLMQVFLKSGGQPPLCSASVTKAKLEWKKSNGTTVSNTTTDWAIFGSSTQLLLGHEAPDISLNTGVNFVSANTFPLSQFDGVRMTFWNGEVPFMTMDIPKTAFNFIDTQSNRQFISMKIGPDESRTHELQSEFENIAYDGFADVARIYPQQDIGWRYGADSWLHIIPIWMSFPFVNLDDEESPYNYGEVRGAVDDYLDPGEDQFGMALVDESLQMNSVSGRAPRGGKTGVTFNRTDKGGYIFLHEGLHLHDWVDDDSPNHDPANSGHSRYDEGQWDEIADCNTQLTYRNALINQTGSSKRIIRLDTGKPYEFPLVGCKSNTQPRSIIAYTPNRYNDNTFLEPLDYRFVLNELLDELNRAPQVVSSPTLRISGNIDASDKVMITVSQVEEEGGALSDAEPAGPYHLQLRNANNALLLDNPFSIATEEPDGGPANSYRFNLRVPFPDETAEAALYHEDDLLWSQNVSSNAPTVSLSSPAGGTFSAEETIPVMWQASDADGDALHFALDYSPDDGQNWILLTPYLTESNFDWAPGFVPASNSARLRVRASDGFNTASATSDAFILTPHAPQALLIEPDAGQEFTEGETITLVGSSITSDGYDEGEFEWQKNGSLIGNTAQMSYTLGTIGTYTFTLQVTSDNMTATDMVSVTVIADYDQDGMPNDWELSYSLNPLDASDVAGDPDEDDLSNIEEYQLGTHPRQPDTDSDDADDGDEVDAGTDPLDPNQTPPTTPVLNVGAEYLSFSSSEEQPIPDATSIWITNGGPGDLSWSASSDANWLTISPLQGDAPTEVSISADPTGLSEGVYEAQITVTTPNASNSPQTITVSLNIRAPLGPTPTPTNTPTPGPSPTATSTHTPGPSPTATSTHTPGPSPTPTSSPVAEGEKLYLPLIVSD